MLKLKKKNIFNPYILIWAFVGFVGFTYDWITIVNDGSVHELGYQDWIKYLLTYVICILYIIAYFKNKTLEKKSTSSAE